MHSPVQIDALSYIEWILFSWFPDFLILISSISEIPIYVPTCLSQSLMFFLLV